MAVHEPYTCSSLTDIVIHEFSVHEPFMNQFMNAFMNNP